MSTAKNHRGDHRHPGFFGKVPTHGDFVHADLDPQFQHEFDRWLQHGIAASQQALGEAWEKRFLAAPPWRFALSAGLCGPKTVAGVFLPSRDRIGRCFPLVVTAQIDGFVGDPARLASDRAWFLALEAVAATAVQPDLDIAGFRAKLRRIRPVETRIAGWAARGTGTLQSFWWAAEDAGLHQARFSLDGMPDSSDFLAFLPEESATSSPWTTPSPEPDAVGARNAPIPIRGEPPAAIASPFSVLRSAERPALRDDAPSASPAPSGAIPKPTLPLAMNDAAVVHGKGLKARVQADTAIVRPEVGLFGVVDGIADDRGGIAVSTLVAEALQSIEAQETVEVLVAEIKGKLGRVHSILRAAASNGPSPASGASVAVLACGGGRFHIVWAGDVRCYLQRDGMMRCLTRDHVAIGMRRRLSRSIGGVEASLPDALSDALQTGDRFLICSSSLPRTVSERSIAGTMIDGPPSRAAELMVQDAMLAGVADNVTALVLSAQSD